MGKKEKPKEVCPPSEDAEIRVRRLKGAEQKQGDEEFERFKKMLGVANPTDENDPEREAESRWVIRSEWQKPDPSTAWRDAGWAAVAIAATAMLAAVLSNAEIPMIPLPWAIGASSLSVAGLCFLAHFDVNRGRKAKRSEIIEEHQPRDRNHN
jgi:hypothetical protein